MFLLVCNFLEVRPLSLALIVYTVGGSLGVNLVIPLKVQSKLNKSTEVQNLSNPCTQCYMHLLRHLPTYISPVGNGHQSYTWQLQ